MPVRIWVALLILCLGVVAPVAGQPASARQGEELLGLSLAGFPPGNLEATGKVVLIRFFSDRCPYCANTIPLLNDWQKRYGKKGLLVLGIYHPKPAPREVSEQALRGIVKSLNVTFSVVNDCHWQLLRKWWLRDKDRDFTSATLILDRHHKVAAVQPGGTYRESGGDGEERQEAARLRQVVERLLR